MSEASPDLSEFFKLSRPKKKPCVIGFAIAEKKIKGKEVEQLAAACDTDPNFITASSIVQWLAGRGVEANVSAVVAHRKKTCSCHD